MDSRVVLLIGKPGLSGFDGGVVRISPSGFLGHGSDDGHLHPIHKPFFGQDIHEVSDGGRTGEGHYIDSSHKDFLEGICVLSRSCRPVSLHLIYSSSCLSYVAGHSLGEYTALAAAGVFDFTPAVRLAWERGRLMHEAGLARPGGMAAIIGLDEALLAGVCQQTDTRMANINSPGQIVISGAEENLNQAMDLAKAKGAYRTIPLQVSGAFHTPLMQPAVDGMAEIIATLSFNDPTVPIIGNTTAQPLTTAEAVKEELLSQLCNCIQWQPSIEYMINEGVSTFIELGPGKVLAGLIKRIDKGVKIVNIGDAEAVKNITQEGV